MSRQRRVAAVVMAAGLFGACIAPAANATDDRVVGWMLTRTGHTAIPIEGTLSAAGMSQRSAVVMFATTGARAHRQLDYRFGTTTAEWGVDGWAAVNGEGIPSVTCPAACENPVGIQQTVYVSSSGRTLSSVVYIAAYDIQSPVLTITSPGWSVHRWRPHWQAVTTADASGSTTVTAAHAVVGVYRGAQLVGGRYGSFASALLPCDLAGNGSAVFTGGVRSRPMACNYVTSTADAAPKATTWRVSGEVTGASWAIDVLIVVDYPR